MIAPKPVEYYAFSLIEKISQTGLNVFKAYGNCTVKNKIHL